MQKDYSDVMQSVQPYGVGFVEPYGNTHGSLGSGTLISFGNLKGILTCAHVVTEILNKKKKMREVEFVLFPCYPVLMQGLTIPIEFLDYILLNENPNDESDLAFIKLPINIIGKIEAKSSFLNGLKQRDFFQNNLPMKGEKFTFTCGVISEWTSSNQHTAADITAFNAAITPCNSTLVEGREGLDYCCLEPVITEKDKAVSSYEGTSGGSVWEIYVSEQDSKSVALHSQLIGVCFRQTELNLMTNNREIIAHGPKSIYNKLYPLIFEKWKDEI